MAWEAKPYKAWWLKAMGSQVELNSCWPSGLLRVSPGLLKVSDPAEGSRASCCGEPARLLDGFSS